MADGQQTLPWRGGEKEARLYLSWHIRPLRSSRLLSGHVLPRVLAVPGAGRTHVEHARLRMLERPLEREGVAEQTLHCF